MRATGVSSTIAIAAVVVIVLVAGGGYFLLTQGATRSPGSDGTTSANGPAPPLDATKMYIKHIDAFANRTTCSFSDRGCTYSYVALNDYNDQSEVVWQNNAFGGPRDVTGMIGIQATYQALGGIIQSMNVSVLSLKASGSQVTLVMNISGASQVLGPYHGTINAQATYSYTNGSWSISKEVWNFVYLTAPNANAPNPPPVQYGG